MSESQHSEKIEQESGVEIIQYSDEYKEQVKDLIFDVYERERGRHSTTCRPDLNQIKEIYQDDNGNFWVAIKDKKVIGTIGLLNQGEGKASMHRFCVKKEFRSQEKGVSAGLFSTLIKFAQDHKLQKIFLATHEQAAAAIKFYVKNGFKQIKFESLPQDIASRSYMGEDDIIYELDLEQK